MSTVGVRELRQNASEILRQVEAGETVLVTVAGRVVAEIVPARAGRWIPWERVQSLFESPVDPEWIEEYRARPADEPTDPWSR